MAVSGLGLNLVIFGVDSTQGQQPFTIGSRQVGQPTLAEG
jgi:hypothetical protein